MLADLSGKLGEVAIDVKEIGKTAKDIHDDMQALPEQFRRTLDQALERFQLQNRAVRPTDSMSMRNEGERQLVKQLLTKFRELPAAERDRPVLLNNLGKLELIHGFCLCMPLEGS